MYKRQVEQPSAQIRVLAFNAVSSAMSYISPDSNTDRVFNNADSFAMVFDATWRKLTEKNTYETQNEKIVSALDAMSDHPFMISSPETARQVATFRIRLLELD